MKGSKRKITLQHSLQLEHLPSVEEIERVITAIENGNVTIRPISRPKDAYEKAWGVKPKSERA